jgi:hypothetical protein
MMERMTEIRRTDMGLPDDPIPPRCKAFDPGYGRVAKSKKQEIRVAKELGGHRQAGSGSSRASENVMSEGSFGKKGDIKQDFLVEAKRTDAKRLVIEGEWLTKIETEASLAGKKPALTIEIGGIATYSEKDWVMVPLSIFKQLMKKG